MLFNHYVYFIWREGAFVDCKFMTFVFFAPLMNMKIAEDHNATKSIKFQDVKWIEQKIK